MRPIFTLTSTSTTRGRRLQKIIDQNLDIEERHFNRSSIVGGSILILELRSGHRIEANSVLLDNGGVEGVEVQQEDHFLEDAFLGLHDIAPLVPGGLGVGDLLGEVVLRDEVAPGVEVVHEQHIVEGALPLVDGLAP